MQKQKYWHWVWHWVSVKIDHLLMRLILSQVLVHHYRCQNAVWLCCRAYLRYMSNICFAFWVTAALCRGLSSPCKAGGMVVSNWSVQNLFTAWIGLVIHCACHVSWINSMLTARFALGWEFLILKHCTLGSKIDCMEFTHLQWPQIILLVFM